MQHANAIANFNENSVMVTQIALIVSIVLQFMAAFIAIRLTRVTKYNLSWILISSGFLLMAARRLIEIIPFFYSKIPVDVEALFTWLGFIASLFLTVGVLLIRKIFIFLKKVEETRREAEKKVLSAIIQTEEKERKRFAKDMHDGLGPLLSTVKLSVSLLKERTADSEVATIISNTDSAINEAIKTIKEISNNLSPHMLIHFGLVSAIRNFTSKLTYPSSMAIHFQTNLKDERFGEETEVILYRIVCELLNNSIRHANASRVDILLNALAGGLLLSYSDDGVGFDVQEVIHGERKGMGFSNIISRIHSIKGSIDIDSEPGQGVKVVIRVGQQNSRD